MRKRLIYNCDSDNLFLYADSPMRPAQLYPDIDRVAATAVTTFYMCPNLGMNMNFPSRAADMVGMDVTAGPAQALADPAPSRPGSSERVVANLHALVAAGHDPLGLVIERARRKGLETFITFRLNEVHAVDTPDSPIVSRFWREHPQWRVGAPGDPLPDLYLEILGPRTHPVVAGWLPGALNFAVAEVRQRRLAELRECCERYDLDGLDLDFQRFPMYFRPGEEAANAATMTAWVRQVREMTGEIAVRRGRPLLLSARVMARPRQSLGIGMDVAAWANERLLDFVIVSHYLRNDFPLPLQEYRRIVPADLPLYASIEVEQSPERYRDIARQLWRDGADGIMVFNFFTTREGGQEPPFELLDEIGDPAAIRGGQQAGKPG